MAPKSWTKPAGSPAAALILLAALAASSLITTLPAATAAPLDPFGFASLVLKKKLCAETSAGDFISEKVRGCASQALLAAVTSKPLPRDWDCCHTLIGAATGGQKQCACDFVREAANRLKIDVNKECQHLHKFVADEFLFGKSPDKFCARKN